MVQALGRQPGAIRSRLLKLRLISETDDADVASDGRGMGEAAEVAHLSPDLPDRGGRPEREPASPVVPGWELFRNRLSDESAPT